MPGSTDGPETGLHYEFIVAPMYFCETFLLSPGIAKQSIITEFMKESDGFRRAQQKSKRKKQFEVSVKFINMRKHGSKVGEKKKNKRLK